MITNAILGFSMGLILALILWSIEMEQREIDKKMEEIRKNQIEITTKREILKILELTEPEKAELIEKIQRGRK